MRWVVVGFLIMGGAVVLGILCYAMCSVSRSADDRMELTEQMLRTPEWS